MYLFIYLLIYLVLIWTKRTKNYLKLLEMIRKYSKKCAKNRLQHSSNCLNRAMWKGEICCGYFVLQITFLKFARNS